MTVCIWQQTDFTDGFPDLGKDITAFYAAVAYLQITVLGFVLAA